MRPRSLYHRHTMIKYAINDLEQLTGIKAHTIRIWEKRYNIVSPQRTCTNIRFYTNDDLRKLLSISMLNKHGFKISDIARMSDQEIQDRIVNLSMNSGDHATLIESLVVAMIEMDEYRFEKILTTASINLGFEDTITQVIYPFFHKVGMLWQVGAIVPAQEHFISNLIRQKLLVGIDGLTPLRREDPKTFILYLHEGELHEIGLLMYHYILKKRGHRVIYLGQSVPFDDLQKVARIHPPYGLLTTFTTGMSDTALQGYLEKLSAAFAHVRIFVCGPQLRNIQPFPYGIERLQDIVTFRETIDQI